MIVNLYWKHRFLAGPHLQRRASWSHLVSGYCFKFLHEPELLSCFGRDCVNIILCHITESSRILFIKWWHLHLWLQERGIGLPPFSGDPCPCSLRKAVNSSRVMLGLWTEEVSLGVQYSGYDRWYWVPPWLNLTVGLLAPQQGGMHVWVCVHMCGHVCVLEAARGRPVKCSKQIFFPLFSLSPSSCRKGKLCTWWKQD